MAITRNTPSVSPSSSTNDVVRRLDAIIALLVEWQPDDDRTRKVEEQTIRLARAGLRPIEIAAITGRAPNNVSKNIAQARKERRLPKSLKMR